MGWAVALSQVVLFGRTWMVVKTLDVSLTAKAGGLWLLRDFAEKFEIPLIKLRDLALDICV